MQRMIYTLMAALLISGMSGILPGNALASAPNELADQLVRQARDIRAMIEDHQDSRDLTRNIQNLRGTLLELEEEVLHREKNDLRERHERREEPAGGTFSGSCSLDVGGNLFKPDTVLNCSVYGNGAVAYEVKVVTRGKESVPFKGELNPRMANQEFKTPKKRVGGNNVTYEVAVFGRNGQRQVITIIPPKHQK